MSEATINTTTPKIIYALYLAGIIIPFVGIIGVIMAYVNKDDNPEWLQSHYQFLIRTFWIGFLYLVIGALLSVIPNRLLDITILGGMDHYSLC